MTLAGSVSPDTYHYLYISTWNTNCKPQNSENLHGFKNLASHLRWMRRLHRSLKWMWGNGLGEGWHQLTTEVVLPVKPSRAQHTRAMRLRALSRWAVRSMLLPRGHDTVETLRRTREGIVVKRVRARGGDVGQETPRTHVECVCILQQIGGSQTGVERDQQCSRLEG